MDLKYNRIKTIIGRFINKKIFSRLGFNIVRNSSYFRASDPPVWAHRLMYFERLLGKVQDVDGDIIECGVAKGSSILIFLVLLSKNNYKSKHIWGFDSFKGLPLETKEDKSISAKAQKGLLAANEDDVWKLLLNTGYEEKNIKSSITIVPGWFEETLPEFTGLISLIHLDCDLYQSSKCALENLWSKLSIGGIIALDDYMNKDFPGEKIAVDEFFEPYFNNKSAKLCKDPLFNSYYILRLS